MDKFLEIHKLAITFKKKIDNLSIPVKLKATEFAVKKYYYQKKKK